MGQIDMDSVVDDSVDVTWAILGRDELGFLN